MDADRTLNWIKFLDGFIRESVRIASLPPCSQARNLPPALSAGQRGLVRRLEAGEGNAAELGNSLGGLSHTLRAAISRIRRAGVGVRCVHRHGATFYELDCPALMQANVSASLWAGIDSKIAKFYRNRAAVMALA